ncbi:MAG TPA: alpha/beta hydrolase [Acidimicrobiales bacterium]|nr:alpha/beta hydrolase [Acidimicrobiales bacterium]
MSIAPTPAEPWRDGATTPDGLGIALYDFGGRGPDLLLVHATGFCAQPFGPLARSLSPRFRCWGLDLRGHGHSDRPADGDFAWSGFATDVLTAIDHLGLDLPFGFGHSCGGAAVLLAEQARPGLFGSLYCFEPVVMPDVARARVAEHNPLADGARRRRETFPSAEDALANYASKPPYRELDPEALQLYVESGFELLPADEGGDGRTVRLRCRRQDEAATFAAAADHDAFAHLHEVSCPVTLCHGEETDAFGARLMQADAEPIPNGRVEALPGMGHFGPLQLPAVVADSVMAAFGAGPAARASRLTTRMPPAGPGGGTPAF